MKTWYMFYKKAIVAGISGNYEVWAEKTVCDKLIVFRAKQVSIVYKDQHWTVNQPILERLRFCEATSPMFSAYVDGDVLHPMPIEEFEIDLQHFSGSTWFHPHLRHEFQSFCRKIQKVPLNEVRRVR